MRATAVIGACFGDEGKGLMTDYFAGPESIVVRFNGGSQAGHTVVTPDGRRHVFAHIGSGSFKGAATFLSRFFIVNPLIFQKEWRALGLEPVVLIDPDAPLTTPFDMLINCAVERSRGSGRHGSCGLGINETIERCLNPEFNTIASDTDSINSLAVRLLNIRNNWLPQRMRALGATFTPDEREIVYSESTIRQFIDACEHLRLHSAFAGPSVILEYGNVVFEGAQGLLLHEAHPFFPHVTRSKTGMENVAEICAEIRVRDIHVVYVTRSYMTRHGDGPFPTEDPAMTYHDETNQPNPYQGTLRFGRLDQELVANAIDNDLLATWNKARPLKMDVCLAVTHCDQHPMESYFEIPVVYQSIGPTREHVQQQVGVACR